MLKKSIAISDDYMLFWLTAQENKSSYKTKKIPVSRDSIHLENESINSSFLSCLTSMIMLLTRLYIRLTFKTAG
jgi:hypothetical protein